MQAPVVQRVAHLRQRLVGHAESVEGELTHREHPVGGHPWLQAQFADFPARPAERQVVEVVRGVQGNPVDLGQLLRTVDRRPLAQIGRRRAEHAAPIAEVARHQAGVGEIADAYRQVDALGDQIDALVLEEQLQAQLAVVLQQRFQRLGDQRAGEPHRRRQAQLTHRRIAPFAKPPLGFLGDRQHLRATAIERLAGLGQGQPAGGAMQQSDLGAALQLADLLADCRRGHAQALGRGCHRALVHHSGEDRHAFQRIHAGSSLRETAPGEKSPEKARESMPSGRGRRVTEKYGRVWERSMSQPKN
ncbi:conserved hypothetical protein [Pseudomonas aeruginosa 2192]|nr:conserved hypothetical protein [Pseudomonas aeruginosa 2192]